MLFINERGEKVNYVRRTPVSSRNGRSLSLAVNLSRHSQLHLTCDSTSAVHLVRPKANLKQPQQQRLCSNIYIYLGAGTYCVRRCFGIVETAAVIMCAIWTAITAPTFFWRSSFRPGRAHLYLLQQCSLSNCHTLSGRSYNDGRTDRRMVAWQSQAQRRLLR